MRSASPQKTARSSTLALALTVMLVPALGCAHVADGPVPNELEPARVAPARPEGCEASPESAAQMAVIRLAVLRGLVHPRTVLAERPRCERLRVGGRRVNVITAPRRRTRQPVVSRATPIACEDPTESACFSVEVRHGGGACADRYLAFGPSDHASARFLGSSCDQGRDDRL